MSACHVTTQHFANADLTIALAGNPNVGKSSLFNYLTGANVDTANYPGKTVALNFGVTHFDGKRIGVVDLPGTYALGALSEDQWVARQAVLEDPPNAIVAIADATNLARNLYLILQYLDLGMPMVVAVNLIDEAARAGIEIDTAKLSKALSVPVVPTVATQGKGIDKLIQSVARLSPGQTFALPTYDSEIEMAIGALERTIRASLTEIPYNISPRVLAILLLEQDATLVQTVAQMLNGDVVLARARQLAIEVEARVGEPLNLHLPRSRHELARAIALEAQVQHTSREPFAEKMWRWSVQPLTGIPTLILVLIALFSLLFSVGNALSEVFSRIWGTFASPPIQTVIGLVFGNGVLGKIASWGLDAGIAAALGVGIPYVLTFYVLLAILEDSGYMNSIAFLLDALMRRLGLHGRSAIILLAAAGCNVPALMGTRMLTTRRERIIASTLVVLMPCSARIVVIVGGVALLVGWQAGAALLLISFGILLAVGIGLNRLLPGHSDDLVMEMFPFRTPALKTVVRKTWHRFKEFVMMALPIVLLGSLFMGALYETGTIWAFSAPLAPVVEGWLGLPSIAGLTLLFAILRKELALQFLVTLALVQYGTGASNLLLFMTPQQLFVYALVNTLYLPCIATFAVLRKELGTRTALGIGGFTIGLAVIIGGIANHALAFWG
ncbi:MAG: ferrous iron transport protein B [Chloroflexi bacterium]|nr:ferrous iron transport protein B [Chloroflexota bacterium]